MSIHSICLDANPDRLSQREHERSLRGEVQILPTGDDGACGARGRAGAGSN